ncbi:MAG: adenylyl-sulfate kinase [Cellulosilyticaceae bacterium]
MYKQNKLGEQLKKISNWQAPPIKEEMPYGDMPGERVVLSEELVPNASVIFKELCEQIPKVIEKFEMDKLVITISGGSGVGKSSLATLLTHYFREEGIGCYNLSGDNYPRRIPKYNDAERLQLFRENALKELVRKGEYTQERFKIIHELQLKSDDANEKYIEMYPWYKVYIEGGRTALEKYLGTPEEIRFEEVQEIINRFKKGEKTLWLKRMGSKQTDMEYEEVDVQDTKIIILEWTHGNSDYLSGIDIPILLNSTPQETLAYRQKRKRDEAVDSSFTTCVLEIEQKKIHEQAKKAKIILSKEGKILTYEMYLKVMDKR